MLEKNMVFRLDAATHKKFVAMCSQTGMKSSQVMRLMVDSCLKDSRFILSMLEHNMPAKKRKKA